MPRLTKTEIESRLLTGATISWTEANDKNSSTALSTPQERRLFSYILGTEVREPTGLSEDFIEGLVTAFDATNDPATDLTTRVESSSTAKPWRLQSLETEEFGGLNICGGPPFHFDFDMKSFLIEGPNGSGKSSLVGAIISDQAIELTSVIPVLVSRTPSQRRSSAPWLVGSNSSIAPRSCGRT